MKKVLANGVFFTQSEILNLDLELFNECLRELNLKQDEITFVTSVCTQEIEVVSDEMVLNFNDLYRFSERQKQFLSVQETESLSIEHKTLLEFIKPSLQSEIDRSARVSGTIRALTSGNPSVNSKFHVDFLEEYSSDFDQMFAFVVTLLPSEKGPTTLFLKSDKKIEIPILTSVVGDFDFDDEIHELLDLYVGKLINKYSLSVESMPSNKWIKVPRMFLHASPSYDSSNASDRIFGLFLVE